MVILILKRKRLNLLFSARSVLPHLNFWERPNFHPSTGIFPPSRSLGRGHASGLTLGPPPLLIAPGRGQNWISEPASSIGSQGRTFHSEQT